MAGKTTYTKIDEAVEGQPTGITVSYTAPHSDESLSDDEKEALDRIVDMLVESMNRNRK